MENFDIGLIDIAALAIVGLAAVGAVAIALWKNSPVATWINAKTQQAIENFVDGRQHLTPASKYLTKPVFEGLKRVHLVTGKIDNADHRAAARMFAASAAVLLTLLIVCHLALLAVQHPSQMMIVLLVLAPFLGGLVLWFWGSPRIVALINDGSARAIPYHARIAARTGKVARYGLRPAAWGFKKIHDLTEAVEDGALRAGLRAAAWSYWAFLVLAAAIIALVTIVEVVLVIAAIVVALLIIGLVAGGAGSGGGDSTGYTRVRERITRRETGFWGGTRDVVYEDGEKVGEERVEKRGGIFGLGTEEVKVSYDADGNEVGTTRRERRGGVFGIGAEDVDVSYDADGREVGKTQQEERGGLMGFGARPVQVGYDDDGNETSQTEWEERGGILGIGAEQVKVTRKKEP